MMIHYKPSRSKATIKTVLLDNRPRFYLITIAKHQVKDYVHKSDLDNIVVRLKTKHDTLHVIDCVYEISDKYRQLHIHAIARLGHTISYKQNNSFNGYRVQWSPIYNWKGALSYLTKVVKSKYRQEQIFAENNYNHSYGFV